MCKAQSSSSRKEEDNESDDNNTEKMEKRGDPKHHVSGSSEVLGCGTAARWLSKAPKTNVGKVFGKSETVALKSHSKIEATRLMIKRDNWGHPYFAAIGEILGLTKDEQLRKHLPRVFSLMKNKC